MNEIWVKTLVVALLLSCVAEETTALGPWLRAYANYFAQKLQVAHSAKQVAQRLKGFRFYLQPVYDFGVGPWYPILEVPFNGPIRKYVKKFVTPSGLNNIRPNPLYNLDRYNGPPQAPLNYYKRNAR